MSDQVFVNSEESEASEFSTADAWKERAETAMTNLTSLVSDVPTLKADFTGLNPLSIEDTIRAEIQKHLDGCPMDQLRPLSWLQSDLNSRASRIALPTMNLREFAGSNPAEFKHIKSILPSANAIVSKRPSGPTDAVHTVSVQVYKTVNSRDTKQLEIDLSLSNTLLDLFKIIVDHQPESKMFDGPSLAGSGMIMLSERMYVTGPEDYSAPYVGWADQYSIPHSVHRMEEIELGSLPDLPSLVASRRCCFLFFAGNEMRRIFFSDLCMKPTFSECMYPMVTYRRRPGRIQKCVLCTSRAATLVVLNDLILPQNPSFCCNPCYRRIRSDPTGAFILPDDDVIVSQFSLP
jgi:hypothetical protein